MYMYSMYILCKPTYFIIIIMLLQSLATITTTGVKSLKPTKKNYIYIKHKTKDLHCFINRIYKYLKISMYKSLCIYMYL